MLASTRTFGAPAAQPLLPVLAKATEALCGLAGVELEDVQGGTFLRRSTGEFEWLPGLVHAPSEGLEAVREGVLKRLEEKRSALESRFGLTRLGRYEVDVERESMVFSVAEGVRVLARATLIATYSLGSCAWAWGGYNKNVPPHVQVAAAALVDEILERDMWELSTPVFCVDEATAWVLAAFVCDRAAGESVYCLRQNGGLVFLLLRDVHHA